MTSALDIVTKVAQPTAVSVSNVDSGVITFSGNQLVGLDPVGERGGVIISNCTNQVIYIGINFVPTSSNYSHVLGPGGDRSFGYGRAVNIHIIGVQAAQGTANVAEFAYE